MSVIFGETPKQQPRDSALKADSETELAASLPLTITLWLYFDQAPGATETQTLYWYGDANSQLNHIVVEATKNASAESIDFTATLRGSTGPVSATATNLPVGVWMMVTVIVEAEVQSNHRVTLYVNDSEEDSAATNVGTVSPGAYDRFLLGAADSSGGFNFGRFRAEHVAIWEPVGDPTPGPLSASEIQELFEERWAPITPPNVYSIGRNPGIAYWMLVGHWSAGIEADNGEDGESAGMLFNRANPPLQKDKPPLKMLDLSKPVVWSAKTPVMQYLIEQPMTPGPLTHPRIPPASRLQPHFYVFNTTGALGTFKYSALEIPVFTHPNFIPQGLSSGFGANRPIVPVVTTPVDYLPAQDVALIAKRVADYMEFAGLKRGVGSVGDGLYEGHVIVLSIGVGDSTETKGAMGKVTGRTLRGFRGTLYTPEGDPVPFVGTNNMVPLEVHPLDRVQPLQGRESNRPWQTWFNAHGTRLVKDYMDGFWTALKRELDARDLCYPRTLWWDQEDWAVPTQAVRVDDGVSHGTFYLQLSDARAFTEHLMDSATHGTLDEIWDATKPSTPAGGYDDTESVTADVNQPFLNWYLGWSIVIGQQAMWRAMMEKAQELFPLAVWSNYDRFSADNPGFKYVGGTPRLGYYNTPPASQAMFHGDYSSPKLYTAINLHGMVNDTNRLAPEMGVTHPQVMRNIQKSRIDACTNAFTARPVAPHFETGLKRWSTRRNFGYDLTHEDVFDIMAHAWKRGVIHFLPFVFNDEDASDDGPADYDSDAPDEVKMLAQDRMYEVCFRLLNSVHWMPQENHARAPASAGGAGSPSHRDSSHASTSGRCGTGRRLRRTS